MNWNEYFFKMADLVSEKSKDESTKVGCVIVGPEHEVRSTGYNGIPRNVNDTQEKPERHERPEKYYWYEHAERNAIYNAARNGIPLNDCTMYVTMYPCADCARGIIQSGIKTLKCYAENTTKLPDANYNASLKMLQEAGVNIEVFDKEKN